MLTTCLAVAAILQSADAKIAFVARYYTTASGGGPLATSVYVCDGDGKHLTKVASPGKTPFAVLWAGSDRLVWLCDETAEESEVWTSPWPKIEPKLLGQVAVASTWHSQPGIPLIGVGQRGAMADSWLTVDDAGDLVPCPAPHDPYEAELPITTPDAKFALTADINDEGDPVNFTLHDGAKSFPLKPSGMLKSVQYDSQTNRCFVKTTKPDASKGDHWWLYTVDWGGHILTPRITDYSQADFWPDRDATAYCQPKSFIKLGKNKTVPVSPLYYGNWRTGQVKKIVSGSVLVTYASVKP